MDERTAKETFVAGDRVRFIRPNESTGAGTIVSCHFDLNYSLYKIQLDAPWREFRKDRWQEYSAAYADASQIERIVED